MFHTDFMPVFVTITFHFHAQSQYNMKVAYTAIRHNICRSKKANALD